MIVIFCDGSSHAKSKYVGVGVIGFRADDNGVIEKHLFSIRSEFSAIYAQHNVHEDFAVIKALAQAKNYPDEQVIICNDHLCAVYNAIWGDLSAIKSPARYHIWKNMDLSLMKTQKISLVKLSRQTLGMQLADMAGKKYIDRSVIESQKFKAMASILLDKTYYFEGNAVEKNKISNYYGNIKQQWKPSAKHKHVTQPQWELTAYEKKKAGSLAFSEYFQSPSPPALHEEPSQLNVSCA